MLLDPEFKGALLSSEEHIAYLNMKSEDFHHHSKEIVYTFNLAIYMHRQSCLTQQINEQILSLTSNGLLQAWAQGFVDNSYLVENKEKGQKRLTNNQLLGAYELLALGLAISFCAFLLEFCSQYIRCFRRLLGNL